jgi:hypothetical protein
MNFNTPNAEQTAEILENNKAAIARASYGPAPAGYVKCTEIAKALNEALVEAGAESRKIPPQMVYNYAKKGVGGLKTDQYPFVPEAVAQEWAAKQYVIRTAQAEAELANEVETDEVEDENDESVEQTENETV